jgi:hypothetical protein
MERAITIGGRSDNTGTGGGGKNGGNSNQKGGNSSYPNGSNGYGGDHGGRDSTRGIQEQKITKIPDSNIYSPPPTSERVHSCLANTDQLANYNLVALYKIGIQGQNGKGLLPLKVINLSNNNLDDFDAHVMNCLYMNFELNLDVLNLSNNNFGQYDGALCIMNLNMYPYIKTKNINLSNNGLTDKAAKQIADNLDKVPHLKTLNVSGNLFTKIGEGYFAKALHDIKQGLYVTLVNVQEVSKNSIQNTIKTLLFIAKSNGVETKDALTTYDTIQHCKKGFPNVAKNIVGGLVNCVVPVAKYANPEDLTLQDIGTDALTLLIPETAPFLEGACITEKVFFSVVDEDFANCLLGIDNIFNH